MSELTPQEKAHELQVEFMLESANLKLEAHSERRTNTIRHINAILDCYLDLWPELGRHGTL